MRFRAVAESSINYILFCYIDQIKRNYFRGVSVSKEMLSWDKRHDRRKIHFQYRNNILMFNSCALPLVRHICHSELFVLHVVSGGHPVTDKQTDRQTFFYFY